MTNHFPGATKMVLSPAAQAVIDAYYSTNDDLAGPALAAALRSVVEHCVPDDSEGHWVYIPHVLAIADELDDVKYGTYRSALSDKPQ